MSDLAKLRTVKACDDCRWRVRCAEAVGGAVSCDSCLRLVVAAVMEEAAKIADDNADDPAIGEAIREAAKEGKC